MDTPKPRPKPNPYHGQDLAELYAACQRRAGELLDPDPPRRTPEQRSALAVDTAHLLLAAAPAFSSGRYKATEPEREIEMLPHRFQGAFEDFHRDQQLEARYRTLRRAADAVFGGAAYRWIRDGVVDGQRAYDLALESDAGLGRVLEHLAGLFRTRDTDASNRPA